MGALATAGGGRTLGGTEVLMQTAHHRVRLLFGQEVPESRTTEVGRLFCAGHVGNQSGLHCHRRRFFAAVSEPTKQLLRFRTQLLAPWAEVSELVAWPRMCFSQALAPGTERHSRASRVVAGSRRRETMEPRKLRISVGRAAGCNLPGGQTRAIGAGDVPPLRPPADPSPPPAGWRHRSGPRRNRRRPVPPVPPDGRECPAGRTPGCG